MNIYKPIAKLNGSGFLSIFYFAVDVAGSFKGAYSHWHEMRFRIFLEKLYPQD